MPSRDRDLAQGASGTSGTTPPRKRHAKPAPSGVAQAALVTHLVVLVCVAGGVYIAWHQGTQGGGRGGAIAGGALLVAAVARLLLPTRLAGMLAVRHRMTDVVTLVILGASLLTAGLVLPVLWTAIRTRDSRGPPMKGKQRNV
jgi:TRAP-type mannitol/chloroaromatic compound transport system permease large subunit